MATTLKKQDLTIEPSKLTPEKIATISDSLVQDLAEISQLKLPGNLHIKVHFQHTKIIINNPDGPIIIGDSKS